MTILGLDDTDSRQEGMCTTFVAHEIATTLRNRGSVTRLVLVRLAPSIPYKTRGNAAVAIHTSVSEAAAFDIARSTINQIAKTTDQKTNPGLVVAAEQPGEQSTSVARFARSAMQREVSRTSADRLIDDHDYRSAGWQNGRGCIGALAAVGAWSGWNEWTYESITYRDSANRGTERSVDAESVRAAARKQYPAVWDTVDRHADEIVCIPNTPGPVLYGIRGDDPEAIAAVIDRINSEQIAGSETFVTNQGTDAHLQDGTLGRLENGRAYRVTGIVSTTPATKEGGHVLFELSNEEATLQCVAFEPTKRFRDRVRSLRPGDRITVCGEVSAETLKLEKFAIESLVRTERVVPQCPECERAMESAGVDQGYRCRECKTSAPTKIDRPLDRSLQCGWYEVPPRARRHIAKPLVRGGFSGPTHPEQ